MGQSAALTDGKALSRNKCIIISSELIYWS